MTFQEIKNLTVADCRDKLEERLLAKMTEPTWVLQESEFEAELEIYKVEKIRNKLSNELDKLVQNNCATVAAFPESASNYSAWLKDNVENHAHIDTAIANLEAIQAKEIELAALSVETAELDVRVKRIDKVFRKILVDMAHDALIAKGFSEKEIKELKDV